MSFKTVLRNTLAGVAFVFATVHANAANYNPTGVQNDVDYNAVINGGWSVVYKGFYGATASIADVFGSIAAGSKVMLAAKQVNSSVFDVLAWAKLEEVTQYTAYNTTHLANGTEWYYNGGSMGFAGAGDTINQNSADINGSAWQGSPERDRLSWHTAGQSSYGAAPTQIDGGWRAGTNIGLNSSSDWERYVLVANVAPVPEPETYAMLLAGVGMVAAAAARRRRKQAQQA